jgi:Cupredoxin-like domain
MHDASTNDLAPAFNVTAAQYFYGLTRRLLRANEVQYAQRVLKRGRQDFPDPAATATHSKLTAQSWPDLQVVWHSNVPPPFSEQTLPLTHSLVDPWVSHSSPTLVEHPAKNAAETKKIANARPKTCLVICAMYHTAARRETKDYQDRQEGARCQLGASNHAAQGRLVYLRPMRSSISFGYLAALAIFSTQSLSLGCKRASPASAVAGRISIDVGAAGFNPSQIGVGKGVPLTLEFRRTSNETCATKVVFPELNLERELPINESVAIEIPTEQARTLTFQCGMGMYKSSVVVH